MSKMWEEMTADEKAEEIDALRSVQNKLVQEFEGLKRRVEEIGKAVKALEKNVGAGKQSSAGSKRKTVRT
jgi:hypothetical protein